MSPILSSKECVLSNEACWTLDCGHRGNSSITLRPDIFGVEKSETTDYSEEITVNDGSCGLLFDSDSNTYSINADPAVCGAGMGQTPNGYITFTNSIEVPKKFHDELPNVCINILTVLG